MEESLGRLASSSSAMVAWYLLAATTVAILLLCLAGLRSCLLRRYRLGSLLIVRWICLADICFVLHRVVFLLLTALLSTGPPGSKLIITWTCKLYTALESLLTLVQTWLLVLLAMERAAMKLRPDTGLRYFNRLRLRVGIAIAGILAFSLHINYIYVFTPVTSAIFNERAPGAAELNFTMPSMTPAVKVDFEPHPQMGYNDSVEYQEGCAIDFGFETFYNYVEMANILLGVYLPVLIVNTCVVLLCSHYAARGFTRLSNQQAARLLPPGSAGNQRALASLARFNNTIDALFLALSLFSYVPMESIGIYKAFLVHTSKASHQFLYELVCSMFMPAKNLLDALLIGPTLIYLLSAARLGYPKPPRRPEQSDCNNRVTANAESAVDIELDDLNPGGNIV